MKPETSKLWTKALAYLEEAEELKKFDEFKKAMGKAIEAFLIAIQAINALSRDLKKPDLEVFAENAVLDFVEFILSKDYTPNKMVDWVRSKLIWLSDNLQQDTFLPLK